MQKINIAYVYMDLTSSLEVKVHTHNPLILPLVSRLETDFTQLQQNHQLQFTAHEKKPAPPTNFLEIHKLKNPKIGTK